MNDANHTSSPGKISQTVDNSPESYEGARSVTVLEKNETFSLYMMWSAFIRQTSQEIINSHKSLPNPLVSPHVCYYGTLISLPESGGAIALVAGTTLGYDENGNLTTYGSKSYEWDYRNRLASSTESGSDTVYKYDHNNQRVKKTHGAVTTIYPNQYYSLEGATSTKYIWAGDELVSYIEGNGVSTSTYYVHGDHLGSTNAVTNMLGYTSLSKDYYPYGSSRISSGDADLARGFIGQFEDEDLSYLNARYYEGARGQFLSQDPTHLALGDERQTKLLTNKSIQTLLTDPQVLNSYGYGRNNPIINKDPTGNATYVQDNGVKILGKDTGNPNTYYESQDRAMLEANASLGEANRWNLSTFANQVKPGGNMDYKNNSEHRGFYFFNGQLVKAEEFGNLNYGYTGSAFGFGKDILTDAGGMVQIARSGKDNRGPTLANFRGNFDAFEDTSNIISGANYYNSSNRANSSAGYAAISNAAYNATIRDISRQLSAIAATIAKISQILKR